MNMINMNKEQKEAVKPYAKGFVGALLGLLTFSSLIPFIVAGAFCILFNEMQEYYNCVYRMPYHVALSAFILLNWFLKTNQKYGKK